MWNIFFKTRINNPTVNIHMDPLSLFLEISTSKSFRSWLVWKMLCGCTWFHECCWYSKMFVESGWIMTLRNYSGWYEYRLGCLRGKQEHLTQLWLCERSFIFAAKERSIWIFFPDHFRVNIFCWYTCVFEVLLNESSHLQPFSLVSILEMEWLKTHQS